MAKKFKYGRPVSEEEMPKPKRLPEYDECLREFLSSGHDFWEVNTAVLPSTDIKVILSSLKWRVKNKDEFKNKIRVSTSENRIYLQKVKNKE